jgi:hypothetical protein
MAVESPASFLQGSTYSAEVLRHVFGTLLARGANIGSIVGGLVNATDMQVTAGSGMQVLVGTGEAWINGTSVSTQGGYLGRVTSSTALAISASDESNPRIETIIAQVKDKAMAGGEETFTVSVVVGTAESGATLANKKGAGAVPASSLVLAYVLVPAKAVTISGANIENVAALIDGGLPPGDGLVDTNALGAEAVTGPKLGAETFRILAAGKYSALTTREPATEFEANATRPVQVTLQVGTIGEWSATVTVGGVVIGTTIGNSSTPLVTFIVPPGVKWKWERVAGVAVAKSTYLTL